MAYLQSSQNFVRALKAAPSTGEPSKIQVAREAWDTPSFHVPNKGETIVDWALTRLLKDRANQPTSNPILDLRYWELLADVLYPHSTFQTIGESTRMHKTWLLPLLNRTPIAPIVISLFNLSTSFDLNEGSHLFSISCRSISLLWPLAVQKFTPDSLLDCFGALLGPLTVFDALGAPSADDGFQKIGSMVTLSLKTALSNSSNKKKLHQIFVQNHLESWLRCMTKSPRDDDGMLQSPILSDIYAVGVELLFNLDILRQLSDANISASLFSPFKSIIATLPDISLPILPHLLASFAQNVRKHRSAIFGPGDASLLDARASSVKFFAALEEILRNLGDDKQQTVVWKTRGEILTVVEKENLFAVGSEEAEALLKQVIDLAIHALGNAWEESRKSLTDLSIKVLHIITRIDYELIDDSIPRILPNLLTISTPVQPSTTSPASELLLLLLSSHSKTRTLPTYIACVLTALASPLSLNPEPSSTWRTMYTSTAASPILMSSHLEKLSRSVHAFFTPGQLLSTTRDVLSALQNLWEGFSDAYKIGLSHSGVVARKKRRKSAPKEQVTSTSLDVDSWAIRFAHAARVVSSVISALPVHFVMDEGQEEIRDAVRSAMEGFVSEAIQTSLDQVGRAEEDRARAHGDEWAAQVVGAAALRLRYAVEAAGDFGDITFEKAEEVMVTVVSNENALPEYRIEIFRALFKRSAYPAFTHRQTVINAALTYLERYFASPTLSSSATWAGRSSQLSFEDHGYVTAAVGLLRLVLDRWLPVIEIFGSAAEHERLVGILLAISGSEKTLSTPSTTRELTPFAVVLECLHSADFWEKSNIRAALLTVFQMKTSSLDAIDVAHVLARSNSRKSQKNHVTATQIQDAAGAYNFLLYSPSEYLSRSSRNDLLKRAIALDIAVGVSPSLHQDANNISLVVSLRTFLLRTFSFMGSAEHQLTLEYVLHMIETTSSAIFDSDAITLSLIDLHLTTIIRDAEKGTDNALIQTVKRLIDLPFDFDSQTAIPRLSGLRLMSMLIGGMSASVLSQALLATLMKLYEHIAGIVHPLVENVVDSGEISGSCDVLECWCQCIAFGRWIGSSSLLPAGHGRRLIQVLSAKPDQKMSSTLCNSVLAVLLTELQWCTEISRESQISVIVAAYVLFSRSCEEEGPKLMDVTLAKICRKWAVTEFSHALELVLESMSTQDHFEDMTHLVHIMALMLREAPEGTLKVVQLCMTRSLDVFVNHSMFYAGSPLLRQQVLDFMHRQCTDHPTSLRPVNLANIWSLLSKYLSGSDSHDAETRSNMFHDITAIIGALVRLRRDLISTTLPHLCIVLSQLIRTLRSPRPHLGMKQHKLVADTFPRWIDPSRPLGVDESKALARLLSTLATKSIVRTHMQDTHKHESLSRPLAKHVTYVIEAYVDALNDPLCGMSTEVRRELQPGLFILCGMLSEHARDALMISALDAGGKTAMKQLWREYEKQKYVGKG